MQHIADQLQKSLQDHKQALSRLKQQTSVRDVKKIREAQKALQASQATVQAEQDSIAAAKGRVQESRQILSFHETEIKSMKREIANLQSRLLSLHEEHQKMTAQHSNEIAGKTDLFRNFLCWGSDPQSESVVGSIHALTNEIRHLEEELAACSSGDTIHGCSAQYPSRTLALVLRKLKSESSV